MDKIKQLLSEIFARFQPSDEDGLLEQLRDAIQEYRVEKESLIHDLEMEIGDLR